MIPCDYLAADQHKNCLARVDFPRTIDAIDAMTRTLSATDSLKLL